MLRQVLINGLIAGSIYTIIAVGFALIYSTFKFFHVAYGIIFALGAYITYACVLTGGYPLWIGALAAVIVCTIVGLAIDQTAYRRFRKQQASPLSFFLGSFGIYILLQGALAYIFGNRTRSVRPVYNPQVFEFADIYVTEPQFFTFLGAIAATLVLYLVLHKTVLGLRIRSVADNPSLANYVGIKTESVAMITTIISSAFAAIAGWFVALQENLTPGIGFPVVIKASVISIIAGSGNIFGAILGAFIIGLLENIAVWQLPTQYKDGVALVVLTLLLLFKPAGILTSKLREDQTQDA
jgi:branched-chain amino acid transport system permease protein